MPFFVHYKLTEKIGFHSKKKKTHEIYNILIKNTNHKFHRKFKVDIFRNFGSLLSCQLHYLQDKEEHDFVEDINQVKTTYIFSANRKTP